MNRSLVPAFGRTVARALVSSLAIASTTWAQDAYFAHPDGTTHWYRAVSTPAGVTWDEAHTQAAALGGYLASIHSADEANAIFAVVDTAQYWTTTSTASLGPWLGGVQRDITSEPAGGWVWSENELWTYSAWSAGQPDNDNGANRICFGAASGRAATWHDVPSTTKLAGFVVEFAGTHARTTVGLLQDGPSATDLFTLVSPLAHTKTFLLDPRGRVVHEWSSNYPPGVVSYLENNGHLLRAGRLFNVDFIETGGDGGIVEEFDFEGNKVWEYTHSTSDYVLHHDFERLPNGNILMLAWEKISKNDAIAAGRDPNSFVKDEVWPDKIIEVRPTGPTSGVIVWEWHAWDHIVQDFDPTKPHYAVTTASRPDRIDVNYVIDTFADWMHANAIDYNASLDQIMVSIRSFDEIWIIDHSTTTVEAAGETGGNSGRGGNLLYRWGNPRAYKRGSLADQKLFKQHDAHWIPNGLPGAGNVLVFNNGIARPGGNASSVDEIVLPRRDGTNNYVMAGPTWGPNEATWSWKAPVPTDFYSAFVSGAQRLPNGNTRICGGWIGEAFEVTPSGTVVWAYTNPVRERPVAMSQGDVPTNNWLFRAPAFAPDHPAIVGKNLVPGEPLERDATALLVDGSRVPAYIELGETATFSLNAQAEVGKFYLMLTSATAGLQPIDSRFMRMAWDDVALMSATAVAPTIFVNYFGTIDAQGHATAQLALPPLPALKGATLYNSFLVLDFSAPTNLSLISNSVTVHIKN
ncbi:MAG: aryl-sulfate sulfotransferase [Planctomycetes bacterium]|nr:aryl-sulfate sulfotransferase [Planctomycetota bacterium]